MTGPSLNDITERIIAYESEGLPREEEIALFQDLIDTGMAFNLQGHYGRTAAHLIHQGLCKPPAKPH
jgi:hypothetical protein